MYVFTISGFNERVLDATVLTETIPHENKTIPGVQHHHHSCFSMAPAFN